MEVSLVLLLVRFSDIVVATSGIVLDILVTDIGVTKVIGY